MNFKTNKEKGNSGLGMAIAYFTTNGYVVSIPLNDTQDYDLVIEKDGNSSKEVDDLLDFAIKKQTEYINRGYARITGKGSYKANGVKAPVYQVPEAYQAVTDSKGNIKFVPGAHTPLAWAQASLYDASKNFMDNLERYSELKNEL